LFRRDALDAISTFKTSPNQSMNFMQKKYDALRLLPSRPYGLGVIVAQDDSEVEAFIAADPASQINQYEFHPMMAILPPA
jgi:hypothetical protein